MISQTFKLNWVPNSLLLHKEDLPFRKTLLICLGVLLLTIASKISIPLKPVPVTFQSITVILIGVLYGARYGACIVSAYLMAGLIGLPVFSEPPVGIAKLVGPTGGYLMGFLPAVILSGYLSQKGWTKNFVGSLITACLGVSLIFLLGASVLALFVGVNQAIQGGVQPFVVTEFVKLVMAGICLPKFYRCRKQTS